MTPSKLDRELAAAVGEQDDMPPALARPASPTPPTEGKGNVRLLLILLVMAGGIVALVMSFSGAAVYSKAVDQVLAERAQLTGRRLRVDGTLVHGTLVKRDSPCEYRFQMQKNGAVLPVRYAQCVVPDTFRDVPGMDVGVTVEGKLAADGSFEASQVLAKCPSKYDMKDRAAKGEAAPHAPLDESPGTN